MWYNLPTMADHVWTPTPIPNQEKCTKCGWSRSISSTMYGAYLADDDCPGAQLTTPDWKQLDFYDEPVCKCDIRNLLSSGHDAGCHYKRSRK